MRALWAGALAAALCAAAPASPPPSLDEAAAAFRAGERKKALELLAAARPSEGGAERRERAALLYADLKDYAAAESMMNDLIRESPDEPRLRLYLATIVARAGDRAATLRALAEARGRNPTALDRQRMAFLHQDFKDYAPARELLDGLIAESPRDLSIRLDRASLAAQSGERDAGLRHLAAARKLAPGPEERRRMAGIYRDLRELGPARELLDGLIKDSPGDGRLRFEAASLAERAGDRAAALAAMAEALRAGLDLDGRRRAALFYQGLGENGEARAVLQGLVKDAPRAPGPRVELAEFEARRGSRAAALEALAEAARLEPDLQERQHMSLVYEELKDFKTARRMIDALIAEQPEDPQLRLNRAYFAADAGDRAGALAFLDETLARAPDPDDRRRIATLYERLGEHARARAALDDGAKKSR